MSMEERPAEAAENAVPYLQQFREKGRITSEPFFSTPELRQRLDLLRHLTDNSEKILLVKGADGAGKSTLLHQFSKQAREEWDVCCIDANHTFHPDQFFSHLYRRFGLSDAAELTVEQLLKRFELLLAAGRMPVIVIDDAHLLPVATMIAVFRLFERRPGNRALIRIVLFAAPDIVRQFHTPQLQAMNLQSVQSLDVPVLDADQAQSFIQFLLDLGDESRHVKIAAGGVNRIVRESAGLPGLLESNLRRLFLPMPKASKTQTPVGKAETKGRPIKGLLSDLPRPVFMGAAALGVVLFLTLLFQDEINRLFMSSPPEDGSVATSQKVDGSVRPLQLPIVPLERPAEHPPVTVTQAPELSPEMQTEGVIAVELPSRARQEDVISGLKEAPLREIAPAPEQLPAPDSIRAEIDAEGTPVEAVEFPAQKQSTEMKPGREQSLAMPSAASESEMEAVAEEKMKPPVQPASRDITVVEKSVLVDRPVVQASGQIQRESWLRAQAPKGYTLQLVGVKDEQAVLRFVEQYQLKGDIAYFKTIRSGQAWFSVLYGVYRDRAAALKARDSLPPALRKSDVWPRSFASVQEAIK